MTTSYTQKGSKDELFLQLLIDSKFRPLRHLVLLLLLAGSLYQKNDVLIKPFDTYAKIAAALILLGLLYLNMYRLIPRLVFKQRYLEYFLWLLFLFVVMMGFFAVGTHFLRPHFQPDYIRNKEGGNIFAICFMFIVFIAASATIKLFQRWIVDSQRINDLETTTMRSELEQLKNQINPHFLFNTLNNANVLTKKDPDKASQVLMKLSDLLRYQLYDSSREKVLLTADIHFLEDFFNLEKIRRDNFDFILSKVGDLSGVFVAPFLFITFVENAVKHNTDPDAASYVHLFFEVNKGRLNFRCINSKPQQSADKGHTGGLGLANVKRRLELLYPGKHTLDIADGISTFTINLNIIL
jgi:sensor histidine kinase YesM